MAEKDDKNLIGFDPLAWMNEDEEAEASSPKPEQVLAEEKVEQVPVEVEAKQEVEQVQPELTNTEENEIASEADDLVSTESKVVLDSVLNIQNVKALYDELLSILNNDGVIEIDASAVSSIDTATLQLLIVFKQEAIKLHKEVSIDFPSDRFIEAAELLGLAEMLDVESAAAGFF